MLGRDWHVSLPPPQAAYVCVYRHTIPTKSEWCRTEENADDHPLLTKFLAEYNAPYSLYDWGDDPSFFGATDLLGDVRKASWGVCRHNIRPNLDCGDYVVFFCGRRWPDKTWGYWYIGVGTVAQALSRDTVWADDRYRDYRQFLNILARPDGRGGWLQYEQCHPFHKDWRKRMNAPYIIFEPSLTHFNVTNPLPVATYDGRRGGVEAWQLDSPRVDDLHSLLFRDHGITRHLRTANPYVSHNHINLADQISDRGALRDLRDDLLELSPSLAERP
jgi:hypothetical protein